jgi:hypothetical protein
MSKEAVLKALQTLDATNDEHWTSDGLPLLDNLKQASGIASLTRAEVTAALPGFSRATVGLLNREEVVVETSPDAVEVVEVIAEVEGNEDGDSITDILNRATEALDVARAKYHKARIELEEANSFYDDALIESEKVKTPNPDKYGNLEYLAAQQKRLEDRAKAVIASRG